MNRNSGRGKREAVGFAKDFNFQKPVIYVMSKLTIWVSNTPTANFESITHSYEIGLTQFFTKLENLSIPQMFNSSDPFEVYGN